MNELSLFLPCAAGVEPLLATEVAAILQRPAQEVSAQRAGVAVQASWREVMLLNLHSRLAQRVLVRLRHGPYRSEDDIYALARDVPWEMWFGTRQTFKVDITAQRSPLKSLNFAALRVKDALVDRFRDREGERPSVEVRWPDARVHAHLTSEHLSLFIDTSGEPLFKRGWRADKGDAPLKETLAAAMLAACGYSQSLDGQPPCVTQGLPLYDPCCGSGTIAIEAAQIACGIAAGSQRYFGFEKLLPFESHVWEALRRQAIDAQHPPLAEIHGSDVAFRMVDFASQNAQRAGVEHAVHFRGGDALQRNPPIERPGVLLLNPPYGERIEAAGVAGRQRAIVEGEGDFFLRLAQHWREHYPGWTAWILTPDLKLPGRMRLKENRRVPLWNGPIECRLFRFQMR
ncbi:MAG: THUMP domain-containing protein [Alphaproteobacteria bacterium]|nr:THUMP domain-containing protein [Alphaproteobacteria bacterium]